MTWRAVHREAVGWTGYERGGTYKRVLGGHQNRLDPETGLYLPVGTDLEPGPHTLGGHQFAHCLKGSTFIYAGEMDDPANTTLLAWHLAESPGQHALIKARDVNAVAPNRVPGEMVLMWSGLWEQTDLFATALNRGIRQVWRWNAPGHPLAHEWDMTVPGDVDVTEGADGWTLTKGARSVVIRRAYAWDSADGGNLRGPGLGSRRIPVAMTLEENRILGDGRRLLRWRKAVDAAYLVGASYPVHGDPTIITAADIEDTLIQSGSHNNWGGQNIVIIGESTAGNFWRGLYRYDESLIPAGPISSHVFKPWRQAHSSSAKAGELDGNAVADARPWVVGTATGSIQAGSVDWFDYQHGSGAWSGGGASHADDIQAAGASMSTYAYGPYIPAQADVELSIPWPTSSARVASSSPRVHGAAKSSSLVKSLCIY